MYRTTARTGMLTRIAAAVAVTIAITAVHPQTASAQIVASPVAQPAASAGPRLPAQYVPRQAPIAGERTRADVRATGSTDAFIYLSTGAIIVGIILLVLLVL